MFSWKELWSTVLIFVVWPLASNAANVSPNAFFGTASE
jgi:hypothetical protein